MSKTNFSDDYKRDAALQINERDYTYCDGFPAPELDSTFAKRLVEDWRKPDKALDEELTEYEKLWAIYRASGGTICPGAPTEKALLPVAFF